MASQTGKVTETIVPFLCVHNGLEAIEFYIRAFGAVETMRFSDGPDRIGHSELRIGEAVFTLADEYPEIDVLSPRTLGGSAVLLYLRVPDVDAAMAKAVAAGAKQTRDVADQDYGERNGKIVDPFGHGWMLSTPL